MTRTETTAASDEVSEETRRAALKLQAEIAAIEARRAHDMVQAWTVKRNEFIKEAVAAGGTLRDVGAAVGLSHTAVRFITGGRGDR